MEFLPDPSPEFRAFCAAIIARGEVENRIRALYGLMPGKSLSDAKVSLADWEAWKLACDEVERTRAILRGEVTSDEGS